MEKIYVFGHRNPDTDSVCSAISLSYLKNKLGLNTVPVILSDINNETKFALEYFNVNKPTFLNDVKLKIKDLNIEKNISLMNMNLSTQDIKKWQKPVQVKYLL